MNLGLSLTNNMSMSPGGGVAATVETPVVIANDANTTVAAQGSGVYRVTKTGGAGGSWDAGAIGQSAHAGYFVIRINPRQVNANMIIGVHTTPALDQSFGLPRARFIKNDGSLDAYENGAATASNVSTYTASDYLFIRRAGSTITLLKGATTSVSAATVIHTYNTSSASVTFDSSFNGAGAAADCYSANVT